METATAIIEIACEIFDEMEFTMAMNIRLGLGWNQNDLSGLFFKIMENSNENKQFMAAESENSNSDGLYIHFNDFITYFDSIFVNKNILNKLKKQLIFRHYQNGIKFSEIKKNISVLKIKNKLRQIEKMVNLLEEILNINY